MYESHIQLNAKMIAFAGFSMPLQYTEGISKEHLRVRNHVGLFDVSHMGQMRVKGAGAITSLQWMTSNNVDRLDIGTAQYSLLTNFEGGIVDDILIYCLEKGTDYLVCVNAVNKEKDLQWMEQNKKGDVQIIDESSYWALIAVQGPKALQLANIIFGQEISTLQPFRFILQEGSCIARTGYTGEEGLEVFVPEHLAKDLWQRFLEKGKEFQIGPIGLGARDSLRVEMKYSLYGHEIDEGTNPIEAGLGWAVKFKKGDFIGRDKILRIKEESPSRRLVGFKMLERGGIPRRGYKIYSDDSCEIGHVTSGILSPTLSVGIGIGYVKVDFEEVGHKIQIGIRQRFVGAEVVKTPFIS